MSAFNLDGKVINVGDRVTIIGVVVSVSTTDQNANVVIQPPLSASTFTVKAPDVNGTTKSLTGAGANGHQIVEASAATVAGLVTAISGSGNTATLTVSTFSSGTVITIPAGAVRSDNV